MNKPFVYIVLLNWNGVDDTVECIESIKKNTYTNYRIVIVDNGSSGNDVQELRDEYKGKVDIIKAGQNYGFPGGCNIGIKHALEKGADCILLLNNDAVVDGEFLDKLVEVMEKDNKIGIVGSLIYFYDKPDTIQYAGGNINWWLGIDGTYLCNSKDVGQFKGVIEKDYICYASVLIKKDVFRDVGYLDEHYFFSIEEFDFCTRAKRVGYKTVLQPASKIWHKWATSYNKFPAYPETMKLLKQKLGWRSYKLWWRLYKTYSPPVWFVVPFVLQITPLSHTITLVLRGKWGDIYTGIKNRFRWEQSI